MKNILPIGIIILLLTSCSVINPGEVGIKQTFGKLHGEPKSEGVLFINPFFTKVVKVKNKYS